MAVLGWLRQVAASLDWWTFRARDAAVLAVRRLGAWLETSAVGRVSVHVWDWFYPALGGPGEPLRDHERPVVKSVAYLRVRWNLVSMGAATLTSERCVWHRERMASAVFLGTPTDIELHPAGVVSVRMLPKEEFSSYYGRGFWSWPLIEFQVRNGRTYWFRVPLNTPSGAALAEWHAKAE